jgi:2-phospho-L-lactate guanylyltransferase
MTQWVVIPVKPLRRGKSRLAGVLTENERENLNRDLLLSTLEKITGLHEVGRILIVSRDPAVLALARSSKVVTLQEYGKTNLNLALKRATLFIRQYTVRSVLVLPADLPILDPLEIQMIFQHDQNSPLVVVVPDRHHQGTNALFMHPPGLIEYGYGPGSFIYHCQQANKSGADLAVLELPSLALDLDTPEDLELVESKIGKNLRLNAS